MNHSPQRLALAVLLLIATASPAFSRPPECYYASNDGCDIAANFDVSENTTFWSVFCDNGTFYQGTMTGNQVPAICGQH